MTASREEGGMEVLTISLLLLWDVIEAQAYLSASVQWPVRMLNLLMHGPYTAMCSVRDVSALQTSGDTHIGDSIITLLVNLVLS